MKLLNLLPWQKKIIFYYFLTLGRKLSDPSQGIKAYWKILNRVINKRKTLSIPLLLENGTLVTNVEKSGYIKLLFCSTVLHYHQQQCSSQLPVNMQSFSAKVCHRQGKVSTLIRALDATKAHGCDDIPISIIKICDAAIVEPICLNIKKNLEIGVYPSIWKKANIALVHKKTVVKRIIVRPLCSQFLGKFSEKIIFYTIYSHLCDHGLITLHRCGFRPGDSAINHFLFITHIIYTASEEIPSKETRAVFLYMSKVFDRVWDAALIYKLKCSGVSGELLTIVHNFLNNRQQCVALNGKYYHWGTVSAGAPQGSVLGSLFFLVYINDIIDNIPCDIQPFADDTSLSSVVRNNSSNEELNRDLERLRLWLWQWKMHVSANKTEEVIFANKKYVSMHVPLQQGNVDIDRKMEHKHIGMVLDSKPNFQSHVRDVILKARRGI